MFERPGLPGGISLVSRLRQGMLAALALVLALGAVPAHAVPQSKVEQARAVKAQVERLDKRAEIASDNYGEAAARHAKLVGQKRAAQKRLKRVTARTKVVQRRLNTRASTMYRQGQIGIVQVLLGAESFEEFASKWDLLRDLNASDADAVAELKELRAQARAARREVSTKERAAAKEASRMLAAKRQAEADLAERKRKLRGLEREIAALMAAEERARAGSRAWSSGPERSFPPPTRAPRSEVVSIAKRYLGAPYRWAASGPNAFDCSGFTKFVYRQVGVSLPHSSRMQINVGERVSRADLQPGDLVFFGSPIHHVGMYVGGGSYIHAPRTGDVVRIASMARGDYAGACRP